MEQTERGESTRAAYRSLISYESRQALMKPYMYKQKKIYIYTYQYLYTQVLAAVGSCPQQLQSVRCDNTGESGHVSKHPAQLGGFARHKLYNMSNQDHILPIKSNTEFLVASIKAPNITQ